MENDFLDWSEENKVNWRLIGIVWRNLNKYDKLYGEFCGVKYMYI